MNTTARTIIVFLFLIENQIAFAQFNPIAAGDSITFVYKKEHSLKLNIPQRSEIINVLGMPDQILFLGHKFDYGRYHVFHYEGLKLYLHEENENRIGGFIIYSDQVDIKLGKQMSIQVGDSIDVLGFDVVVKKSDLSIQTIEYMYF